MMGRVLSGWAYFSALASASCVAISIIGMPAEAQVRSNVSGVNVPAGGVYSTTAAGKAGHGFWAYNGGTITDANGALRITTTGNGALPVVVQGATTSITLAHDAILKMTGGVLQSPDPTEFTRGRRPSVLYVDAGTFTANGALTMTGGSYANGILVQNGGKVELNGASSITIPGDNSGNGLQVQTGGRFTSNGLLSITLNTPEPFSSGAAIYATDNSVIQLNGGANIVTSQQEGITVLSGSTLTGTNVNVSNEGTYNYGTVLEAETGGQITLTKGSLSGNTIGFVVYAHNTTHTASQTHITLNNMAITANDEVWVAVKGRNGARITMTGGSINSTAQYSAIQLDEDNVAVLTDVAISQTGAGSIGVQSNWRSTLTMTGGSITVTDTFAAVYVFNGSATFIGTNILARGASTDQLGMILYNSSSVTMNGGSITNESTTYPAFAVVHVEPDSPDATVSLNLTGVAVSSAATAFLTQGANSAINVTGSSIMAPNGYLFETVFDGTTHSVLNLTVDSTVMTGLITTVDSTANVTLRNGSVWTLRPAADGTTESTMTSLTLNQSRIDASGGNFAITADTLTNAGTIDLSGTTRQAGQTLIINGNYIGNGGTLIVDAVLGDSSSSIDRLIINGASVTGDTHVIVRNTARLGAQTTGDGILVIQTNGANTTGATFSLTTPIEAGAYTYNLERGQSVTDNWFLTSVYHPKETPPPPAPLPDYRPAVPVYMAAPALANTLGVAMIGKYHDRIGEDFAPSPVQGYEERVVRGANGRSETVRVPAMQSDATPKWFAGAWARAFGERATIGYGGKAAPERLAKFEKNGPSYDYDLAGIQTGFDLYRSETASGVRNNAGVYVGAAGIDSDVRTVYGGKAGTMTINAYALGAYWTRKAPSGWYIDAVVQGSVFTDIKGHSVTGQSLKSEGHGFTASLESGLPIALGSGWSVEPQVQVIYQHMSLDGGMDSVSRVRYGDTDGFYGRIGGRVKKEWNIGRGKLTTWARADVWHAFASAAVTTFANPYGDYPTALRTRLGGSWTQIGIGASAQLNGNLSLFAAGDYSISLDRSKNHGWGGRAGLKVVW